MKNVIKCILRVLSIFILLAFVSCNNVITQNQTNKNTADDYAVLKISVDDINGARLIEPFVDENNLTDITLTGVCGTESFTLREWSNVLELKTNGEVNIKPGTWNFTLTAKYNSATYSDNYNNVILIKGDSVNLSFTLTCITPAASGTGSIKVTVTFPANKAKRADIILSDVYDSSIVAIKKTVGLGSNSSSNSLTINESNIADGEYILNIKFYTDSGIFLGTYTELVKVAANYESKANRTITSFNELYTITYVLNNGSWINGTTAPAVYSSRTSVILPTAKEIQRNDYVFGGWFETSSCTGDPVTKINKNEKGNKTFYAKWDNVNSVDISLEEDVQTNNGVAITVNIPFSDVAELNIMRSLNGEKYHKYYEVIATENNSFNKSAYTVYDYSAKQGNKYSYYAEITIGDSTIKTKTVSITATVDSDYTMPLITNVPTASYDKSKVLFKFNLSPVIQRTVLPYGFTMTEPCLNYLYNESSLRILFDKANNKGEYSLFAYSTGQFGFTGYGKTAELDGFYCKMTNPSDFGLYYIYSDDSASAEMPETLDIPNSILQFSANNTDEGIKLIINIPSQTYNVSGNTMMNVYRNNVKIMDYAFKVGETVLNDRFVKAGETYEYKVDFSYNDFSSGMYTTACSETVSITAQKNGSWSYELNKKPVISFTSDYKASSADYMQYKFVTPPKMLIYKGSESGTSEEADEYVFTYRKYNAANSYDVTKFSYKRNQTNSVIDLRGYAYNSLWTNSTLYLMSSQATCGIEGSNGSGHYYINFKDSDIDDVPAALVIPSELEFDISGSVSYEAKSSGNTVTLNDLDKTWVTVTTEEKGTDKTATIINTAAAQNGTITVNDTLVEAGKTYKYTVTYLKYDDDSYKFYGHYNFELKAVGGATYGFTATPSSEGIDLSFNIPESNNIHVVQISRSLQDESGNQGDWKAIWEYADYSNVIPAQTKNVTDFFVEQGNAYLYRVEYYNGVWEEISTRESAATATVTGLPSPAVTAVPKVSTDLYNMCLVFDGDFTLTNFTTAQAPDGYTLFKKISYAASGDDGFYADIDFDNPSYSSLFNANNLNRTSNIYNIQLAYCSSDGKSKYKFETTDFNDEFPEIRIPATLDRSILSIVSTPEGIEVKAFVPKGTTNVSLYNNSIGDLCRRYYDVQPQEDLIITMKDRYDCRKGNYYQYHLRFDWWQDKESTNPVLCLYDPIPKPTFKTLPSGTFDSKTNKFTLVKPELEFYGVDSSLQSWHLQFHYKCEDTGDENWNQMYPDREEFDYDNSIGGLYTLMDETLLVFDEDREYTFELVPSDFPDMPQTFFVAKEYTVSFQVDGQPYGTAQTVVFGDSAKKPADPTTTLSDYVFTGWLDADGKLFDFNTPIKGNVVLSGSFVKKAKLNATVTVRNDELEIITEKLQDGKIKFYKKNKNRIKFSVDDGSSVTCKTFYFDTAEYGKGVYVIKATETVNNRTYSYTAIINVE